MKIISKAKYEDIVLNHMLKKGSDKSLDDFLGITQNLSNKKRYLINVSKWKQSIGKQKLKTIVINFLNNLGKKNFRSISTLTLIFDIDVVDVVKIDKDTYCLVYKLKREQARN